MRQGQQQRLCCSAGKDVLIAWRPHQDGAVRQDVQQHVMTATEWEINSTTSSQLPRFAHQDGAVSQDVQQHVRRHHHHVSSSNLTRPAGGGNADSHRRTAAAAAAAAQPFMLLCQRDEPEHSQNVTVAGEPHTKQVSSSHTHSAALNIDIKALHLEEHCTTSID
jgi:hypothetical protein